MARGEDRGGGGRATSASERVYRALMRAYPKEVRRRYGDEMAGYFGDLCREESRSGGPRGLALLWARTLPELVFTVIKERTTMLASNARSLPASPQSTAKWGSVAALLGGGVGTAYYLVWAVRRFVEGPMAGYGDAALLDLSSMVIVLAALLLCVLGSFGLYGAISTRSGRPGGLAGAGAALGALAAVSWIAASALQVVKQVAAWPGDALWSGWELRLDASLSATGFLCWIAGLLLLGLAAHGCGLAWRLRALPIFAALLFPAGFAASALLLPDDYGLNGAGMDSAWFYAVQILSSALPFLGSFVLGLVLLRADVLTAERSSSVAGGARAAVGRATSTGTRAARTGWTTRSGARSKEAAKEKDLLEALRRRGELTVAGAVLETSLSVEEADRMLSGLASRGHLEVRAEYGRLSYSLWEGDG